MKKSLILLPMAALILSGCAIGGGSTSTSRRKKTPTVTTTTGVPSTSDTSDTSAPTSTSKPASSEDPTSSPTSKTSTSKTTAPQPTSPGGEGDAVDFDLTPGTHTAVLDFEGDPDRYSYPRAEEGDTEGNAGELGGCGFLLFHSYKGSYEGQYWLMMKDKDNWDATSNAWFANTDDLGSIESLEVVVRTGASAKKKYDLSVGSSAFSSAQTGGSEFDVNTVGSYEGSGNGFFCVSTKMDTGSNKYNGQISKITVTYTIS